MQNTLNVAGLVILAFAAFGISIPQEYEADLAQALGAVGCLINIVVTVAMKRRQAAVGAGQGGYVAPAVLGTLAAMMAGLLLAIPAARAADSVVLQPPSIRQDGTPLRAEELAECRLYRDGILIRTIDPLQPPARVYIQYKKAEQVITAYCIDKTQTTDQPVVASMRVQWQLVRVY